MISILRRLVIPLVQSASAFLGSAVAAARHVCTAPRDFGVDVEEFLTIGLSRFAELSVLISLKAPLRRRAGLRLRDEYRECRDYRPHGVISSGHDRL